jgi:hypothetical protein
MSNASLPRMSSSLSRMASRHLGTRQHLALSNAHRQAFIRYDAASADVDRFNRWIRPTLARQYPNDPYWKFEQSFDLARVHAWLDYRASEYVRHQCAGG